MTTSYILYTTSLVLFTAILFPTTGPSCCLAETLISVDSTVDHDEALDSNVTDLTTNHHQQLPRPIVIPLDTSQVQPKRMKHKVTIKRRKNGGGSHQAGRNKTTTTTSTSGSNKNSRPKKSKRKPTMQSALQTAARKGLEAMVELFDRQEPEMLRKGDVLEPNDPGAMLAKFSSSDETPEHIAKAGYAALVAAKQLKERNTCRGTV
uniref:(northern house mosquito) hypothetical protein n=1 Tax=Culex pipiens TaxID=7175 RepID=A0A8D8HNY8_CULPI